MTKFKLFTALACMTMAMSCNEPEKEIPEEVVPQPYQIISTSFGLPELGINFESTEDVCQSLNIYQELSYGGNSGYEYINGLGYRYVEDGIEEVIVRFRMRGFNEIYSSRLEATTLYTLCRDNPEQCFANLMIVHDDKRYNAMVFQSIPFQKEVIDPNASYSYSLLSEPFIMECFENRTIIPVGFDFDGYLYTADKQDSLRVADFKTQFWVMESF